MKFEANTRTLVAILFVVGASVLFWMLLISPKMKESDELGEQVEGLQATLTQSQSEVAAAENAKRNFPKNYRQLVVLGKAVPAGDETASLLVQLNTIAAKSKSGFDSIQIGAAEGSASTGEEATATSEGATSGVPPTEAEASLLPLGATIGPAGLGIMPYNLIFTGSFFHLADFINGIDSLVHTEDPGLSVDGRLMTIDGFSLEESNSEFPRLEGNFSVTTFVVPPGQTLTAGASSVTPEGEVTESVEEGATTEATETAEGTPSASVTEEAR